MPDVNYPLAPQGIFRTIQGEGMLLGLPMVFVRFGGCSVGCAGCDTDYSLDSRLPLPALLDRISQLAYGAARWVWLSGGEPTDHDLRPLVDALHDRGLRVALATAGTRQVQQGALCGGVDFLSVSPHDLGESWVQRRGDQLNLVPGLGGLRLPDLSEELAQVCVFSFSACYVTPFMTPVGTLANLAECISWVQCHQGWRLGVQAHQLWGVP